MKDGEFVRASLREGTRDEFQRRVASQADALRDALADRRFDGQFTVGLELEGIAVDADYRLADAPDAATDSICEPELGAHNAEVNTPPTTFGPVGLDEQATELTDRVTSVRHAFDAADRRFVTDGIWTISPPAGALAYLTARERRDDRLVPANMTARHRYHALDADITAHGPVRLDVPGCTRTFPTILVESLATSMQIHLQTPTDAFTDYFDAALRTAGPVLALATNSPFLPPDIYDDPTPETVLDGPLELRIPIFETMNVDDPGKVRFPHDLDTLDDAIDCIVDDRTCAPYLREWLHDTARDDFASEHWEFLHKQGTCWRWIRPILGPTGPRIEYRPLPAQPTTTDVLALQALVVGLLHGIVTTDHPLPELPWTDARDGFYAAHHDGLDADLPWITRDGDRTTDPDVVYDELFALAHTGLQARGLQPDHTQELLHPIEARWHAQTTPATWKRDHVQTALNDDTTLADAIHQMQRTYIDRAQTTDSFTDWLD